MGGKTEKRGICLLDSWIGGTLQIDTNLKLESPGGLSKNGLLTHGNVLDNNNQAIVWPEILVPTIWSSTMS